MANRGARSSYFRTFSSAAQELERSEASLPLEVLVRATDVMHGKSYMYVDGAQGVNTYHQDGFLAELLELREYKITDGHSSCGVRTANAPEPV